MKLKDIKGKKFNRLLVLSKARSRGSLIYWTCLCECGNKTVVPGTRLRYGGVKSCGCLSKSQLAGKVIGKLKVIKPLSERKTGHVVWLCQCECGKKVKVPTSNLQGGRKTSCGCLKNSKELTGVKFGKLTALHALPERIYRYVVWLCRCECGRSIKVKSGSLLFGAVRSCGCMQNRLGSENPRWTGLGEISGKMWGDIRQSAKKRGILFKITITEAWKLFLKQKRKCVLSGLALNMTTAGRNASLDRIDSSRGYTVDNIQWVHKDINRMKGCFTQKGFLELCRTISKHRT